MSRRGEVVEATIVLYNLDNGRPHAVVQDEVDALLEDHRPHFLIGCEAGGYHLASPGYRTRRRPARTSRLARRSARRQKRVDARRNITVLVRRDVATWPRRPIDLQATWARTKYPELGDHEPRSFPRWRALETEWAGVHQGPPNIPNREAVQREGIIALVAALQDEPRAVAVGDWNAWPGDKTAPSVVADAIGGRIASGRIDTAVVKGWQIESVRYVTHAGGQPLLSDHGHAAVTKLWRTTRAPRTDRLAETGTGSS